MSNSFKKIFCLVLVICMLLSTVAIFTACKKTDDTPASCVHEYTGACDATCNKCGESREVSEEAAQQHTWAGDCDSVCDGCAATREATADHTTEKACATKCDVCGADVATTKEHTDGANGTYDYVCDECGESLVVPGILDVTSGKYTYNDAVATLASNWNPHTYQVQDDSYPISFITTGLYNFVFNDAAINVVEG